MTRYWWTRHYLSVPGDWQQLPGTGPGDVVFHVPGGAKLYAVSTVQPPGATEPLHTHLLSKPIAIADLPPRWSASEPVRTVPGDASVQPVSEVFASWLISSYQLQVPGPAHPDHSPSSSSDVPDRSPTVGATRVSAPIRGSAQDPGLDPDPGSETQTSSAQVAERIQVETLHSDTFARRGQQAGAGHRDEHQLVVDWCTALTRAGLTCERQRIVTSDGEVMYTDVYVAQLALLVEAKAQTDRDHLRAAVGQLYDYRRFLPDEVTCSVLLPSAPVGDLALYLTASGVGWVARDHDGWRWDPATAQRCRRVCPDFG